PHFIPRVGLGRCGPNRPLPRPWPYRQPSERVSPGSISLGKGITRMMNRRFLLMCLLSGVLAYAGCSEREATLVPTDSEMVGDDQGNARPSDPESAVLAGKK